MNPVKNSTRRRHATMACISCRESKVKCDGRVPSCSHCVNKNRECHYQTLDKRKLPLRIAIELLTSRVNQLCQFIRDNNLQPPAMPAEKYATLRKILGTLGMAETIVNQTSHSDIATTRPQSTAEHSECYLSFSEPSLLDIPSECSENSNTNQQAASSLPDMEQGHCLQNHTISSMSSIPHNSSSVIALGCEGSSMAEKSAGNILDTWISGLGFGTCIASTSPGSQHILGTLPDDAIGTSHISESPSIGPAHSDNVSPFAGIPTNESDIEGLIDEISDRFGTLKIGPGGKARFYGPKSTFNLAEMPLLDNYKMEQIMPESYCEIEKEIPANLEDHLLSLYFSWQDPSFHVVDREIYEGARQKCKNMEETPFYSEALRNAMCALGSAFESRYHSTFITFPKTLVEFFSFRAKSFLEIELDCPRVATVQAMVILSSHEIGNGKDTRGWLYSGMALRLAFDLALHLDMSSYVSCGIISATDASLRRTVFWAAYIVDHQLGFHLGRPFRISMDDVTVGKPRQSGGLVGDCRWVPYGTPSPNHGAGLLDNKEEISYQLVCLCELMAPCGYILYGTPNISKDILQELNAKIVAELCKWKATLPATLQINLDDFTSPYLPHVLLLHMQYHQNIIYAHRPWMSKSQLQPQPPRGPGYTHAREMCIQSAIAIAKILNMYEYRYTLRRINVKAVSITSSAILLLLFATVSKYPSEPKHNISLYLSTCFRALDEFTLSWSSAQAAKDLLVSLHRQWNLRFKRTTTVI